MGIDAAVDRVVAAAAKLGPGEARHLIAIAGPPASGKSTLAEKVRARFEALGMPCGLVPMDGFHLDNAVLSARGDLAKKGAPETFDVQGFCALLEALGEKAEVPVPLFDRERDCVVPDAAKIEAAHRHVVVEGNYLFLDAPGWRDLMQHWSLTVFLQTPLETLEARLVQRWLDYGHTRDEARKRAQENDLVNARLVLEKSDRSGIDLLL